MQALGNKNITYYDSFMLFVVKTLSGVMSLFICDFIKRGVRCDIDADNKKQPKKKNQSQKHHVKEWERTTCFILTDN